MLLPDAGVTPITTPTSAIDETAMANRFTFSPFIRIWP